MPRYDYKHLGEPCDKGEVFEIIQSIRDEPLTCCPFCGGPVRRLISKVVILTPTTNTELKEKGFTKLVRRDKGVYENVTAHGQEARYFQADKPETMPHLSKKISD
ncbi:zinc ribbon domain-containing protein [bacterium]|nr:zinc ribbon domain-containing protein [bacterium]